MRLSNRKFFDSSERRNGAMLAFAVAECDGGKLHEVEVKFRDHASMDDLYVSDARPFGSPPPRGTDDPP